MIPIRIFIILTTMGSTIFIFTVGENLGWNIVFTLVAWFLAITTIINLDNMDKREQIKGSLIEEDK